MDKETFLLARDEAYKELQKLFKKNSKSIFELAFTQGYSLIAKRAPPKKLATDTHNLMRNEYHPKLFNRPRKVFDMGYNEGRKAAKNDSHVKPSPQEHEHE